jgi:ABC-type multidrug transport system ATPase subunit
MLAVASFMKTSMLFLDETINNLDPDAISGVAQMLEDFVKQQQIDLYIVTHSTLIQEMNIWDKVIQI